MQDEYKAVLLSFQLNRNIVTNIQEPSPENELISELGKLAKVLIKKQVPQNFLRQQMETTNSRVKKSFFSDIVDFLDRL